MKSSESFFVAPDYNIDNLIYFSDITISKEPIMKQYQELIKMNKYNEAQELIKDESFYGSWVLNLMSKRNHSIYDYVKDLKKPFFGVYQENEPLNSPSDDVIVGEDINGFIWVSSVDINETA